jgi:hypothetical protein
MRGDPGDPDGWQIVNGDEVIQSIPAEEFRLLLHWGADIFMDYEELKTTLDHSDDIGHEQVFDMLIADLRARGVTFEVPTDPLHDPRFVSLLTSVYDPGTPAIFPPEPEEALAA